MMIVWLPGGITWLYSSSTILKVVPTPYDRPNDMIGQMDAPRRLGLGYGTSAKSERRSTMQGTVVQYNGIDVTRNLVPTNVCFLRIAPLLGCPTDLARLAVGI